MRKLVMLFMTSGSAFGKLTDKYPGAGGESRTCLSGDVNKDFSRLYAAVAGRRKCPPPLPTAPPLCRNAEMQACLTNSK